MAYTGFKALVAKGVPPGAAANIGRKKYGKENFQKHAAEGKKMKGEKVLGEGSVAGEQHMMHREGTEPVEEEMHESVQKEKSELKKKKRPQSEFLGKLAKTHDGTGKHHKIGMA